MTNNHLVIVVHLFYAQESRKPPAYPRGTEIRKDWYYKPLVASHRN